MTHNQSDHAEHNHAERSNKNTGYTGLTPCCLSIKLRSGIPATREGARRLGLVTIDQMVRALVHAVENPASGCRVIEVPEIRKF